jgi:alkylation response protein AidB-like acyl-CoA dehydrogenase
MEIAFTHEHEELRQTVRRFLERESTEATVRQLMETEKGYDPRTWERLGSELSLIGLAIPEKSGGAALGAVELAIVLDEMGRVLFCGPYFASAVLAAASLMHAGDDAAKARLLPRLASGKSIGTLALAEHNGRWDLGSIAMKSKQDGNTWRLEGEKDYVIDGQAADVILVAARAGDSLALFEVEGTASGLRREALPTLDLTRKLAKVTLAGTPALKVSGDGDVSRGLQHVLAFAATMLAAEQAGGAQRCLEMSTEYAKTRLQFGRPIGSFQAIKHKCADMLVETEFARSAAYNAAFAATSADQKEFIEAAHAAKAYCSEAYFHAAAENIQIHGGMGFTWEHPAHLYFKRARSSSILFGDPLEHRQKLASELGL